MKTRRVFVGIREGDTVRTHLPPTSGAYATLCGLDGDDADKAVDQHPAPAGNKVDCDECRTIFNVCRDYRPSDFA